MAPPRWATPVQTDYLVSKQPEFLVAQTNNKHARFFQLMAEEWFTMYPVRERLFPTPPGVFMHVLTPAEALVVQKEVTETREVCTRLSVATKVD
jgi:hypothetical protein